MKSYIYGTNFKNFYLLTIIYSEHYLKRKKATYVALYIFKFLSK